jgi:hypothetical protein
MRHMDTARVVHHDTGPPRRPGGRRRWILALALAALAAPLASGSAIAVGGGSTSASSSPSPATVKQYKQSLEQYTGRRHRDCDKRHGSDGSSWRGSTDADL